MWIVLCLEKVLEMHSIINENKNTSILLLLISIFLWGALTCFASGGNQSLEHVLDKATLIFKAKVLEVKKGSDKWGHFHIKAEKIETVKGSLKDTSLLLNFQTHVYAEKVNDKNYGKIKKWYMVPQSGKELKMKKNEVWFFFSYSNNKDNNGFIYISRGEPVAQEKKIRELLKSKVKK
jgi:hypothetical protein